VAGKVNLSAKAEADIDDVLARFQNNAPGAMVGWHARLLAALQTLEYQPGRCPLAAEAKAMAFELRELLFGKRRGTFRILFRIDGGVVNVLHIRRACRGPLNAADLM
jgi:plasmid stabilization system protein ParE